MSAPGDGGPAGDRPTSPEKDSEGVAALIAVLYLGVLVLAVFVAWSLGGDTEDISPTRSETISAWLGLAGGLFLVGVGVKDVVANRTASNGRGLMWGLGLLGTALVTAPFALTVLSFIVTR